MGAERETELDEELVGAVLGKEESRQLLGNGVGVVLDEAGCIERTASKSTAPVTWTPEQRLALRLRATGMPTEDVAKQTGMGEKAITHLCNSPEGRAILDELYGELDVDFQGMYADTIKAIRTGFAYVDPHIKLAAAALWLRYSDKNKAKVQVNITAEDVVREILKGTEEAKRVAANASTAGNRTPVQDSK